MNKNTEKLLKLANKNPDLPIKFVANNEVCVDDRCIYWLASIECVEIEEIYFGKWGDKERVYIKYNDGEDLVEYIAEKQSINLDGEPEAGSDEAYKKAEKVFNNLLWKKCILVYVECNNEQYIRTMES